MNTPTLLKTFGFALALTGIAHAADLTWTSQFSGNPLAKLGFNHGWTTSYSNVFDITTNGFNPSDMTITSAVASFAFADDSHSDSEEVVNIYLGGELFIEEQEVNGSHPYSSFAWYSDDLNISLLADLQADGKLSFTVQILNTVAGKNEDTYLKVAKLVVQGHDNPVHSVPDASSTMALMGAALVSMVALRKRLALRA